MNKPFWDPVIDLNNTPTYRVHGDPPPEQQAIESGAADGYHTDATFRYLVILDRYTGLQEPHEPAYTYTCPVGILKNFNRKFKVFTPDKGKIIDKSAGSLLRAVGDLQGKFFYPVIDEFRETYHCTVFHHEREKLFYKTREMDA
jgi:hypothetical protein